jgi:hypothetical protein
MLDPGAGSSLAALRRRDLVQVRDNVYDTSRGTVGVVEVRLTSSGRAAARAGRAEPPRRRTPQGLLSEWLWRALVTLYRAGDTGTLYDQDGGPSWNALLKLRDRRDGSYMQEFSRSVTRSGYTMASVKYRARISDRGRAHAELHHRCYAELYPDVPPIEPATPVDGAHSGLADHRTRRPRGLVRAPDWRLLVALTRETGVFRGRAHRWCT